MKVSYGVTWSEAGQGRRPARLAIGSTSLTLTPVGSGGSAARELPLAWIVAVEVSRPADGTGPRLLLKMEGGDTIELETRVERWIVADLLEHLFIHRLRDAPRRQRVLLTVGLKPGAHEAARELLRGGPPFDPRDTALTAHEVFLLENEVLFLFEIDDAASLERLVEADFWAATGAWGELIEDGVRLAESAYVWRREDHRDAPLRPGLGY